jgi:hypothetical protein
MPAPDITVVSTTAAPPMVGNSPTGNWFATGITSRGVPGRATSVQSMSEFTAKCGARVASSPLYDAMELFFRDGGSQAYVSRVTGPASAVATLALKDTAAVPVNTLMVNANSVGAWGNGLSVAVAAGPTAGTYVLTAVSSAGVVLETSPTLTSPADAVNWSSVSAYFTITDAHSASAAPTNNPAVLAATPLALGADDNASITEAMWTTALDVFTQDMGPGQISAPGRTTDPAHVALVTHAATHNRVAYLDPVDTATASALVTAATAATQGTDGSYGCICAPWVYIPGIATGSAIPAALRTVPPSAVFAALTAASDGKTYTGTIANTNIAPAGANGKCKFAIGVTQVYNDTDRGTLNVAGVNVIRSIAGVVQIYGFRSMSTDPTWLELSWGRLRMSLQNDARAITAAIGQFAGIDAKGQLFGRLSGALAGMLSSYWQLNALYGATANDAYQVNIGPSVNTPATIAAGQLNATLEIKRSPFAEFSNITISNVPLSQPL